MQILPVLDILAGQVVRGIAGRRAEYRPIVSQLTRSTVPIEVARAYRDHFGLDELYLADLDAIAGAPPALATLAGLLADEFSLWIDAGIGSAGSTLAALANVGITNMIAGLESLSGPAELEILLDRFGPKLIFSLDLKAGQPLAQGGWRDAEARAIADQVIHLGVKRILVLDLAGVGVAQGNKTAEICGQLRAAYPHLEIATGGGVRGIEDLRLLRESGVNRALIASALHDGKLGVAELATLKKPPGFL